MFAILAQTAHAAPPAPPPLFAIFLPWLFLGTILGLILAVMARRKGRNPVLWFLIGMIPVAGFFAGLVLASHPDIALIRRIQALEDSLANLARNSTPPALPSKVS